MAVVTETYEGSCFCRKVRYRVAGALGSMSNCHCTDCRKSHGAAFATYIDVPRRQFAFLQGEDELQTYRAETGTQRSFCRTCGSVVICFTDSDKEMLEVAAATLDTPIHKRPEYHIFVRSKVPWFDIQDGRPQHQTYPVKS
jgi:hypothetical protein